jgi:hypothetical protein
MARKGGPQPPGHLKMHLACQTHRLSSPDVGTFCLVMGYGDRRGVSVAAAALAMFFI